MKRLEDLARRRLATWLDANPLITQKKVAEAIGVSQTWISQFKSGDQGATVDQLDAMAQAFGHTIVELIDLRPDPKEAQLIEAFRKLRPEARPYAVSMLEAMIPPAAKRGRTRKQRSE